MKNDAQASEILSVLKEQIKNFQAPGEVMETGKVIMSGDGIAQAWGLDKVMSGELVEIETSGGSPATGMAMNLEQDTVGIILFGNAALVKEGDLVRRTGQVARVPVGNGLLGRVVDPFGNPVDGLGAIANDGFRPVEAKGPGIVERRNVDTPLQTGIKAIDAMIPIGRGQRELIIGDRRTGKSTIAMDTILNQKNASPENRVHCFYVAIGQKRSSIARLVETFRAHGVMEYTTVVAASASDPASLQYLAPYAATAMAEYYRDSGRHALVIFDDLTKHAQAWRELSLLMRRSPGREAFPGDIFYLHSRLLERAAQMSDALGGGSLTALPVVETQEGDVSAYIPTNVISITDGQIFLEANLFNSGLRPAINVGISVSRVGGDAQIKAMKQAASSLRIDLAQFRELAAFMQFSSDLDPATKAQLGRGERLTEILKQPQYEPIDVRKQVMILRAGIKGRLDPWPTSKLLAYQKELFHWLDTRETDFLRDLGASGKFDDRLSAEADRILDQFGSSFRPEAMSSDIDAGYTLNLALAMSKGNMGINRDLLSMVERITSRELASPSLEKEIEAIMAGNDLLEKDRLQELLTHCPIIDFDKSTSVEEVFKEAGKKLDGFLGSMNARHIAKAFMEREKTSTTAIQPFFAIPHVVVEGTHIFQLMVVRSRKGIHFSERMPKVHTMFFLAGSMDQRHFHLVVIAALARLVKAPNFESDWLDASDASQLRGLILKQQGN